MIHRTHRFHGRKSLGLVFRRGQIVHGRSLSLKYIVNPHGTEYRVAVVVSRKVSKSAVVRNRIRRRIYEAVREAGDNITRPYDLVFLVREAELANVGFKELAKTVHSQLSRAGAVDDSANNRDHDIVIPKEKNS